MKKYFKFLLIALGIIAISCSEDEPSKANKMTIDGASVKIQNVFVGKNTNSSTGKTFYDLYFASEGIELATFPTYDDFTGNGDMFILTLETSDANSLPAGDYTTYDYAALYEMVNDDWNFITDEFSDLSNNGIKVSKTNNTYTFEFAFTGVNGVNGSVFYKGPLTAIRTGR